MIFLQWDKSILQPGFLMYAALFCSNEEKGLIQELLGFYQVL